MATQVSARNACWLDGIAVAAQDLRDGFGGMLTSTAAAGTTGIAATAGVRYSVGTPLACTWTSGMVFNLSAGACFVQGTASSTAGLYELVLDTTAPLTVTASDPTNPRIDSVIAVVVDNGNGTSTAVFKILPGTPAGSPVAPTLPANALLLANIAVAANAVALSAGVFSDKRVWTTAAGGILPYANTTGATIPGPAGSYVDDLTSGRLKRLDGSGNARGVKTGPFTPVTGLAAVGQISAPIGTTSTYLNMLSVALDGVTEIEFNFRTWLASQTTPTIGDALAITLIMDGVSFDATRPNSFFNQTTTNATNGMPMNWSHYGTPSAGTHTFGIQMVATGSNAWQVSYATVRIAAAFS